MRNILQLHALACLLLVSATGLAAQIKIDDKPRRYLLIQVQGATREWEVRPRQMLGSGGAGLMGATEADFALKPDRWERTGLPRRYNVEKWRNAFEKVGPGIENVRFYFYAITPRQPTHESLTVVDPRRREYCVPAKDVTVKAYPMTWVDLFEGYVAQFKGEERQKAVKEWEAAHRDIIRNAANDDNGFTPEERNEFARFYQGQFVFIRDRDPKLHTIYDELVAFHRERGNLDAELSTYLDGIRSGVPSPHLERFRLEVGRILVQRLRLYEDAQPFLRGAAQFSEARFLLARCQFRLKQAARARATLTELIQFVQTPPESGPLTLELSPEEELGRANLLLAEIEFGLARLVAAEAAVAKIPQDSAYYEEGRLILAAMLLYHNDNSAGGNKTDAHKAREAIRALPVWTRAGDYLAPKPGTVYPLDPVMARALVLYAQTDGQYREGATTGKRPTKEVLDMFVAAKALDPLSSEPHLAEGRLWAQMGYFREALAVYMAGLDVNPRDVMLNFAVADLNFKAGVMAAAEDYLGRCLKHEPDFYPALSRLGEISMLDIETLRAQLLIKQNAGETIDYAGELVPYLKEAAAFWTASLAIQPAQPATQLALATLYLQLSEVAPLTINNPADGADVRRAYLTKARDIAHALVVKAREYAVASKPTISDPRLRAEAPAIAAFNTWAFALYSLGEVDAARAAFEEHIAAALNLNFFADSESSAAYQQSASLAYAMEWLRRINENSRRFFEVIEFEKASTDNFWHGWQPSTNPKSDEGFRDKTVMKGGRLHLGVKQAMADQVSRLEIDRPNGTLAVFEADFVQVGNVPINRGIHMTRLTVGSGSVGDTPKACLMLGVDQLGRVYYETRQFAKDDAAKPEKVLDYALIDVRSYGGLALNPDEKLKLALRRQRSLEKGQAEYFAVINGFEVKLAVTDGDLNNQEFTAADQRLKCGFFTQGVKGAEGVVEIERVRFIYDSGLGG